MLELAEKYAEQKGTKIIAHRIDGDMIIFVMESGGKFAMTQAELEALTALTPVPAGSLSQEPKPKAKAKSKSKGK